MCHIKTASIREVRHDFSRILDWVTSGEEVTITNRHEPVARLLPARRKKPVRAKMPDITARLKKTFGSKVISAPVMKKILDGNRGVY
jgi:prevent-host-death family protein